MTYPPPVVRNNTGVFTDQTPEETWIENFRDFWSLICSVAHPRISRSMVGSESSEDANVVSFQMTPLSQKELMIQDIEHCVEKILGRRPGPEEGYDCADPRKCYGLLQRQVIFSIGQEILPEEIVGRCPGVVKLLQPVIEQKKENSSFWDEFGPIVLEAVQKDSTQFSAIPIPSLLTSIDESMNGYFQNRIGVCLFWAKIFGPVVASIIGNDSDAFYEQLAFGFCVLSENLPSCSENIIGIILNDDRKCFFDLLNQQTRGVLKENKLDLTHFAYKKEQLNRSLDGMGGIDVFFELLSPGVLLLADLFSRGGGKELIQEIQRSACNRDLFFRQLSPHVYGVLQSRLLKEKMEAPDAGWKVSQWYVKIAKGAFSPVTIGRLKDGIVKDVLRKMFRSRPLSPPDCSLTTNSSPFLLAEFIPPHTVAVSGLELADEDSSSSSGATRINGTNSPRPR